MHPTLQVQLQVLTFKAEELAIVYYDANFFWEPSRGGPQPTVFVVIDRSCKHHYTGYPMYGLSGGQRLISMAVIAPTFVGGFSLYAHLEHLGECCPAHSWISMARFLI